MGNLKQSALIRISGIVRRTVAVLILFSTLAALCGIGGIAACAVRLQFLPALLRGAGEFSAGTLAIAGTILIATFLFGRFYCTMLCPLGTLQELIGLADRRKRHSVAIPDLPQLRYPVGAIALGLALCGNARLLALLDPYSCFGRIFGAFLTGGFLPLILLILLVLWKRRLFCTALCPAGTLLGLFAKHGWFHLQFKNTCIRCGKCAQVCPAGCIDPAAQVVDQERCLRCLKCLEVCPKYALCFARAPKQAAYAGASRRRFLRDGALLLAGGAAGIALVRTRADRFLRFPGKTGVLPPGAGSKERFSSKCTGCQLCARNCPTKIIVPSGGGTGPVSLDLARGACRFDCNRCSQVCPVGALKPLPLAQKQRTQIAIAKFHANFCRVYQEDEACGKCASTCPTGAAKLRKTGAPYPIDASLCIGCGACYQVCPAAPKAITIEETDSQHLLSGERKA